MKTLLQALRDDVSYPIPVGKLENILITRGLDAEAEFATECGNSDAFKGAYADCLYYLIDAVNFSESDMSISLQDRNLILKKANALYLSIGEEPKSLDIPKVYIGS